MRSHKVPGSASALGPPACSLRLGKRTASRLAGRLVKCGRRPVEFFHVGRGAHPQSQPRPSLFRHQSLVPIGGRCSVGAQAAGAQRRLRYKGGSAAKMGRLGDPSLPFFSKGAAAPKCSVGVPPASVSCSMSDGTPDLRKIRIAPGLGDGIHFQSLPRQRPRPEK